MKKLLVILTIAFAFGCQKDRSTTDITPTPNPTTPTTPTQPTVLRPLLINEFVAKNTTIVCTDSVGENYKTSDWIEIYNPNDTAVNIAGYYLTDSLPDIQKFQITLNASYKTTIPARGHIIFWCDALTHLGPLHTNFKLSSSGEQIGLYTPNKTICDTITFGTQTQDISYGRIPDGGTTWKFYTSPTPGTTN